MYDMQRNFSGNLHALRGLAAAVVVFFHAKFMPPVIDVGKLNIVDQFGAGVTLFFILSGFSLCLSNSNKVENKNWLRGYTIKRVARILPVWYMFVGIHFFYHWVKYGLIHPFHEVLYHLIPFYPLIAGGHESFVWAGWTIGVELMFYLLFPFLLVCFRDKILIWLVALVGAILVSVNFTDFAPSDLKQSYYYMAFPVQGFVFVMGCFLYFLTEKISHLKNRTLFGFIIGLVSVVAFVCWYLIVAKPGFIPIGRWSLFVKAVALGCFTSFAYLNLGNKINLLNPVTKFLGDKSYTIYLMHPIIAAETKRFYPFIHNNVNITELSFLIYCVLVFIITCILATIISNLIEAPVYSRAKRYADAT